MKAAAVCITSKKQKYAIRNAQPFCEEKEIRRLATDTVGETVKCINM